MLQPAALHAASCALQLLLNTIEFGFLAGMYPEDFSDVFYCRKM
jgi:hypothetical protein